MCVFHVERARRPTSGLLVTSGGDRWRWVEGQPPRGNWVGVRLPRSKETGIIGGVDDGKID